MDVFLFKLNKAEQGSGAVLVAAHDKDEAWEVFKQELGEFYIEVFSERRCERILSLTSVASEPHVITFNCYVE